MILYDTDGRSAKKILHAIGEDEITAKDISCRCGLSHSRVRDLLTALVDMGRVKARPHPTITRHPRPNLYSAVSNGHPGTLKSAHGPFFGL